MKVDHGYYGTDLNGSNINLYLLVNQIEGMINIVKSNTDHCFDTQAIRYDENGTVIISNTSYTLCRHNDLENVVNSELPLNNYGYYGQNVMFGDDTLVGKWSVSSSHAYTFEINATVAIYKETANSMPPLTISEYGVDETGEYIYMSNSTGLHLKQKLANHCYNVSEVFSSGYEEEQTLLLCKEE